MSDNIKEKEFDFSIADMNHNDESAYSPTIRELTPKQLQNLRIKKRVKYCLRILNYLLLIGVGLIFVYPFAWMFVMSFRSYDEAILFSPGLWINEWHFENYVDAWNKAKFSEYLGNSITFAVLVLGLQYFFIIPAAYAFARMKFKGNKLLFAIKQLGMMLPGEATMIPMYFLYSKLGLIDTWGGLIFPSLVAMFGIYMFMNNFKAIPSEIIESARMDKAGHLKIMLKIMVPMVFPVFVTHFILTFIGNWNTYYWVLVMTNTEKLKTLPVAITGLLKAEGVLPPWHQVMAGNILQLSPILIMYIFGSQQMKRALIGGRKISFYGEEKGSLIQRIFRFFKKKLAHSKESTIEK